MPWPAAPPHDGVPRGGVRRRCARRDRPGGRGAHPRRGLVAYVHGRHPVCGGRAAGRDDARVPGRGCGCDRAHRVREVHPDSIPQWAAPSGSGPRGGGRPRGGAFERRHRGGPAARRGRVSGPRGPGVRAARRRRRRVRPSAARSRGGGTPGAGPVGDGGRRVAVRRVQGPVHVHVERRRAAQNGARGGAGHAAAGARAGRTHLRPRSRDAVGCPGAAPGPAPPGRADAGARVARHGRDRRPRRSRLRAARRRGRGIRPAARGVRAPRRARSLRPAPAVSDPGVRAAQGPRHSRARRRADDRGSRSGDRGGASGSPVNEFELLRNITIGQYLPVDSYLHRLDPRAKILAAILVIAAVTFTPSLAGNACLLAGGLALVWLGRIPLAYALRGLLPAVPILVFLAVMQLVFFGRNYDPTSPVVFQWRWIVVTAAGFLELLLVTSVFTLSTKTTDLTLGIESLLRPFQRLRVPAHELALVVTIAVRFVPTLALEAERLMKAQASRGARLGGSRWRFISRVRRSLPILVPLVTYALRRGEELIVAMEARAYTGGAGRTAYTVLASRPGDWLAVGAAAVFLAAMLLAPFPA